MRKIYLFLPGMLAKAMLSLFCIIHCCLAASSQVYTTTYSSSKVTVNGIFGRAAKTETITLPAQDNRKLLKEEIAQSGSVPFRFALPVKVDIAPGKQGNWEQASPGNMVWRVKLVSPGAYSTSIDFDEFHLSDDAEMYIYNGDGTMITGPVTSKENNEFHVWGSSIYSGESVIVEVKVPQQSVNQNRLHIHNLSHGYKNLFKSEKSFGASGNCNINVLCPAGTAWGAERNSVALVLNASSSEHCSGAMISNTCGTNTPYFLTANHCYVAPNAGSVSNWKFIFQYWSPNCTPTTDGSRSLLFNGATLRARNSPSDFALLELNTIPASTSGIHYAGWNRNTAAATNATGIHHPAGDVMKISFDNNAPVRSPYASSGFNSHWQVGWDNGVTEGGSSGSPLFDQDHRIIGQLHGGPSGCSSSDLRDFYGAFDVSWTGGGTAATSLAPWLDPGATGFTTTNTTNINQLSLPLSISGSSSFCSGTEVYTVSGMPSGATISWTSSNTSIATILPGAGVSATFSKGAGDGYVTITATVNGCRSVSKELYLGKPVIEMMNFTNGVGGEGYFCTSHTNNEFHISPYITGTYYNMRMLSYPSLSVVSTWGPIGSNTGTAYTYIPGWYVIEAQGVNACGTSDWTGYEVEFMVCSGGGGGEGERAAGAAVKTYPNPVKGELFVVIGKENPLAKAVKPNESVQAELYGLYSGQLIKKWNLKLMGSNTCKLDVRDIKKGQYTLVLKASSGKERQVKQVIIE